MNFTRPGGCAWTGFLDSGLEAPAGEGGPRTEIEVDGVVVGEGVVTLAGRYTNPSGAAGVYSNTWERHRDGSWQLAASVMTFEATDGAGSAELRRLTQGVFLSAWQGRFYPGASDEAWMDPGHSGWSGPSARRRETPARCPHEEVDRVVFNVSGAPE